MANAGWQTLTIWIYASKSLPDACKNYSITELEMTGLVINIHLWKHLLLKSRV